MKLITILPLAALGAAFVIPDEQLTQQIALDSKKPASVYEPVRGNVANVWEDIEKNLKEALEVSRNAIDDAIEAAKQAAASLDIDLSNSRSKAQQWLDSALDDVNSYVDGPPGEHPPHGPDHPPHGPDHPPHGPPRGPHRPPHHKPEHKPNHTIYELIANSKYTTKLAKYLEEFPDLVKELNGTKANYTFFAPTDKAFERLPHHKEGKGPSKEIIKKALQYHFSPDFYPAGRILVSHTIPSSLESDRLGGPQRLRVNLGFKGLTVNFESRVIAANIFATNGVIHGIDHILIPPPPAAVIIALLPSEFSTLQLALKNTGLESHLKNDEHIGGTFFAPSNFAFAKLGPKINAFLFSKYGEKYLKALIEYHIVANRTLYSDAYYKPKSDSTETEPQGGVPKGHYHFDLPTVLKDKSLSVDIARWGGFINIKINGYDNVAVQDGVARDGVIHVLNSILIPPKTPGLVEKVDWNADGALEEFKKRFEPFVENVQQEL